MTKNDCFLACFPEIAVVRKVENRKIGSDTRYSTHG